MTYYILYDKTTYTITKISPTLDGINDPNDWTQIYVDIAHQTYFESNYSNIKYDTKNQALIYPNDYQADELLSNNNSSLYNSLSTSYQNALNTFSSTANSITATVNSASNAINVSNSASWANMQLQLNSVVELSQIKENYNYLTKDEQNSLIEYFFSNTPINLNDFFKDLPSQGSKITLTFAVNSSFWQYIYPQIQQNDLQAEVDGNNIYVRGTNLNDLIQKLNTLLNINDTKSLWSIIHYGKDITVSNVGIYYGTYPDGNDTTSTINSISTNISALNTDFNALSASANNYATAAMVNTTNSSVNNNTSNIANLTNTVTGISNTVNSLGTTYATNSSLNTLSQSVSNNSSNISGINNSLNSFVTNSSLASLSQSVSNNHNSINTNSSNINNINNSLSNYATNSALNTLSQSVSNNSNNINTNSNNITNLSNALNTYATNSALNILGQSMSTNSNNITSVAINLSNYTTTSALNSQLSNYVANGSLSGYSQSISANSTAIVNLSNNLASYATSSQLNNISGSLSQLQSSTSTTDSTQSSLINSINSSVSIIDPAVKVTGQHLGSSDDLNNIHNPGTYWTNYSVPQNAPSEFNGTYPHAKLVVSDDGTYGGSMTVQMLYIGDGAGMDNISPIYIRHDNNNHTTWSIWHSIPSMDLIQPIMDSLSATQKVLQSNFDELSSLSNSTSNTNTDYIASIVKINSEAELDFGSMIDASQSKFNSIFDEKSASNDTYISSLVSSAGSSLTSATNGFNDLSTRLNDALNDARNKSSIDQVEYRGVWSDSLKNTDNKNSGFYTITSNSVDCPPGFSGWGEMLFVSTGVFRNQILFGGSGQIWHRYNTNDWSKIFTDIYQTMTYQGQVSSFNNVTTDGYYDLNNVTDSGITGFGGNGLAKRYSNGQNVWYEVSDTSNNRWFKQDNLTWKKEITDQDIANIKINSGFDLQGDWNTSILDVKDAKDGYYSLTNNTKDTPSGFTGYGTIDVRHNSTNDTFVTLQDNTEQIWTNHCGGSGWGTWNKMANNNDLSNLRNSLFARQGSWGSSLLDLKNAFDGYYDIIGNTQDGPAEFDGYGTCSVKHWIDSDVFLELTDNTDTTYTNHFGNNTWGGWQRVEKQYKGLIDSNADLFQIKQPGIWKSYWGYQSSLKNFPSSDGSATIIAEGSNGISNGLKLRVIDSWGGEYYTYWNNDHFMAWQQVPNGLNSTNANIPHIPSSTFDLFSVTTPGEWYSAWNDSSMKNFPSTNTAAYIKCSGDDKFHGLKLEVLDSWGNEYVSYWDNDHYTAWQQVNNINSLINSEANSAASSATSSLANSISSLSSSASSAMSNWSTISGSAIANFATSANMDKITLSDAVNSTVNSIQSSANSKIASITSVNIQLANILNSLVSNSASSANAAAAVIGASTANNSANSVMSALNSIIQNNSGIAH